jgi:hypothetical protein
MPVNSDVRLHETMATDFAVYYLTQPLGLLVQLALLLGPLAVMRIACPKVFVSIGFRRLMFAQLAVAVVVFLLAAWSAYSIGSSKVEQGHIPRTELYSWVAANSVYLFVLGYIFALVFASFVLTPLCLWLVWHQKGSLLLFAAFGAGAALVLAALAIAFPGNEWGRTHKPELFASTLASTGFSTFLICIAFAYGAGLPLCKVRAGAI